MTVLVLKDHVHRETVLSLARERGWKCINDMPRAHYVMATTRWRADHDNEIAYIEDHTSDVRSISVRGRDEFEIAEDISMQLDCFREDELLLEVESNPDARARMRALNRLSACRPAEVNHRYLAAWARALSDPDKVVRRAAIRTAYGCMWPELAVVVRQRVDHEVELRDQMVFLLQYFNDPIHNDPEWDSGLG